jgi:general secretion pathway protein E
MDAAQDIDGTDSTQFAGAMTVALPDLGQAAALPYVYARDHGFMVEGEADGAVALVMREGADPLGLLEVRRVLGKPLATRKVAVGEFEKLLAQVYAQDGAAQVVGDMGISGDGLDPLALGLPTALTHGSVVASDAFFPFANGLEIAASAFEGSARSASLHYGYAWRE